MSIATRSARVLGTLSFNLLMNFARKSSRLDSSLLLRRAVSSIPHFPQNLRLKLTECRLPYVLRTPFIGGVALVSVTAFFIRKRSRTSTKLSDLIADETRAYSLPFPSRRRLCLVSTSWPSYFHPTIRCITACRMVWYSSLPSIWPLPITCPFPCERSGLIHRFFSHQFRYVPNPSPSVFRTTKNNHNILQGVAAPTLRLTQEQKDGFDAWILKNGLRWTAEGGPLAAGGVDVAFIGAHSPQSFLAR
jgi:hypothetical protein